MLWDLFWEPDEPSAKLRVTNMFLIVENADLWCQTDPTAVHKNSG
jgi:hypothetical protein